MFKSTHFARGIVVFAAVSLLYCAVLPATVCARPDEPSFDTVGAIDGEDILVSGSMRMEFEHGHAKTILRSGGDVRVKSGQARIELVEGGNIIICGPAHFSVLKSAESMTLALDFGVIHAHIEHQPALIIYTAQIQAKPVAIGEGAQDVLVGIDAAGAICIRAASGAVRLEQQLTGQSVIVPQNGDVLIPNGQLDALSAVAGHCSCELQVATASPPPAPPPSTLEVSTVAATEDSQKKQSEAKPLASQPAPQKPLAKQGPIYQVFMPPLTYDAVAKVQPEFDPKFIVLVRRVRVRPNLIFRGRVEGNPVVVASSTAPPNPAGPDLHLNQQTAPKAAAPNQNESLLTRVRNFFRRLWTLGS
jgi:soluble P-type ATPase